MAILFRNAFLVFFVMLQCMAPLLHAHAGVEHHGGLHLPVWTDLSAEQGPAWHDDGHSWHEAVSVASSLEARHDALLAGSPVLAVMAYPVVAQDPASRAGPVRASPVFRSTHRLLPPACAPPLA